MASYFYGENVTPSHSSSSRRGKKNGSDKPKQPQRGLGVAQLESMRLRNQLEEVAKKKLQDDIRVQNVYPSSSFPYSSNTAPSYGLQGPHGVMMGFQDLDKPIRYDDSQPTNAPRWHFANVGVGSQHYVQPSMTRSFLEPKVEDFVSNKNQHDSMFSSSPNSESTNTNEIDLELRLSLYK